MSGGIYVIIPFFQRESGILRRALNSIAAQQAAPPVRVIIVNDSSPVSPQQDIATSALDAHFVDVIVQENAGPAAARNRGLDSVPGDADFVAFLDSDDEWAPSHLSNAVAALGEDLDFYFSNYREPDAQLDQFSQHRRLDATHHTLLSRGSGCYRFDGDMIEQVMFTNVIETSTVVYRWAPLRQLRFRSDYKAAFEDHLFWIGAAQLSRGIAFSTRVECQYGRGVNIWRSAGPGSDRLLPRLIDQRRYCEEISRLHVRTSEQARLVSAKITEIRCAVIADILYRLRRGQPLDMRRLGQFLRTDPLATLLAVPLTIRIAILRRARRVQAAPDAQR